MSADKEFMHAEGVYAIPRMDEKIILIQVPDEDAGKIEGAADWEKLMLVVPGMFGIITGGVEEGERYESTLSREIFEEQGLIKQPEVFTNGLPTAHIKQVRGSKNVAFTVHGHQFPMTTEDIQNLSHTRIEEIADTQLGNFLQEQSKKAEEFRILRPSVHAILALYLEYLEKGEYYAAT